MTIKELRIKTGLSQAEFSKKFGINKGTLANWEQGLRTPPEHVPFMINRILTLEEKLSNITSCILIEKEKDRSGFYTEEICNTYKNAFNMILDVINTL